MAKPLTFLVAKLFILLLCLGLQGQAQNTTPVLTSAGAAVDTTSADQLVTGQTDSSYVRSLPLLPHKMLVTQRVFWGPKGLLRIMNVAQLTAEGRQKELKVRAFMLIAHQVTGYATLAGFVAQGILEAKLANATGAEYNRLYKAQQTMATITNIAYGTTALLSLTAPPKLVADRKGSSRVKLHKYLAIIHLTGFVATNILASKAAQNAEFKPYHRVAGLATVAAFAPALIALKF